MEQHSLSNSVLSTIFIIPDKVGKDYQPANAAAWVDLQGIESGAVDNFMMICNTGDFALSSNNWSNPRRPLQPAKPNGEVADNSEQVIMMIRLAEMMVQLISNLFTLCNMQGKSGLRICESDS